MAERPILFSGPMVRAVLSGAKSQTRRVVKPQATSGPHDLEQTIGTPDSLAAFVRHRCPYGVPGDRLWVRETWGPGPFYRADDETISPSDGWRPSIHMPRWASRLTLEVVNVRVERLQDISDEDARAEGCPCYVCGAPLDGRSENDCHCFHKQADAYDFRNLWDSINAERAPWASNPWCWVVSFKRVGNG